MHIARRPLPEGGRCTGCRLWDAGRRRRAGQPSWPGSVSPRNEHPRVSITASSAINPTAQAAIM